MPNTSPDDALAAYWRLVQAEAARWRATPLSLRNALLCGVLIAALPDHVFAAHRSVVGTRAAAYDDALAFRAHVVATSPILRRFEALAHPQTAAALRRTPVAVPPDATRQLNFADFMVFLYTGQAVETVLLRGPDGHEIAFADALAEALAWWAGELG